MQARDRLFFGLEQRGIVNPRPRHGVHSGPLAILGAFTVPVLALVRSVQCPAKQLGMERLVVRWDGTAAEAQELDSPLLGRKTRHGHLCVCLSAVFGGHGVRPRVVRSRRGGKLNNDGAAISFTKSSA